MHAGEKHERQLHGDAALAGDYAWVRLDVAEQQIVGAVGEGPGVAALVQDVRRRTLLEAAAVPGGTLAIEALHRGNRRSRRCAGRHAAGGRRDEWRR